MSGAPDWLGLIERALQDPGARRVLGEAARTLVEGRADYRRKHWGQSGGASRLSSAADPSGGIIELGALYAITYETAKGGDPGATLYEHEFSRPLPILGYAIDGSGLVIARGRSKYDIGTGGISG